MTQGAETLRAGSTLAGTTAPLAALSPGDGVLPAWTWEVKLQCPLLGREEVHRLGEAGLVDVLLEVCEDGLEFDAPVLLSL